MKNTPNSSTIPLTWSHLNTVQKEASRSEGRVSKAFTRIPRTAKVKLFYETQCGHRRLSEADT